MSSISKVKNDLRLDFWILLAIIFGSLPIIFAFQVKPLISALFFFAIPTIYLFLRKPKPLKRIFAGTLLIGVGLSLTLNVILSANRAWDEFGSQLVFDYRFFGFWPVDEPIWFVLWALFIIVFYEHFYDRERQGAVSKRFLYFAIPVSLFFAAVLFTFFWENESFRFGYAYFFSALPMFIPILYVWNKDPALFLKFFKTASFFFMLYLIL